MAERQQEYKEKLQGLCDLLTQTENRLISHQEAFVIGDGTMELKKCQTKQEVTFGISSCRSLLGLVTMSRRPLGFLTNYQVYQKQGIPRGPEKERYTLYRKLDLHLKQVRSLSSLLDDILHQGGK